MSVGYNERAWAADLVAQLSNSIGDGFGPIKRAGGEYSLSGGSSTLFPDVLLFGDEAGMVPICGWELKFPDTGISDPELHANAREKAKRLKTGSYVVWNVAVAELWAIEPEGDRFERQSSWNVPGISMRQDVTQGLNAWKPVTQELLIALVELYDRGTLLVPSAIDVIGGSDEGLVADLASVLEPSVAVALAERAGSDQRFRNSALTWWAQHEHEFPGSSSTRWEGPMAAGVVALWINRFLLVHLLRGIHVPVAKLARNQIMDFAEVSKMFHALPETTDFAPIFSEQLGESAVPPNAWLELLAFNAFLSELRLESAAEAYGNVWLERVAALTSRRAVGQFKTPRPVADLLISLSVKDVANDQVWDPCCGSGTIGRAMFDRKKRYGISAGKAYSEVWLSDKYATPLQAAQMTMLDASAIGEIVRVFAGDVFEVRPGENAEFADPRSGERFEDPLPDFDAVVTNAPFVRFERYVRENPNATSAEINLLELDAESKLDPKSDLYAYVIARLAVILKPGAVLGLVTSNSWLGANWGRNFQKLLERHFYIRNITISGRGRWFANADVVTVITVLEKKPVGEGEAAATRFATTLVDINQLESSDTESLAAEILVAEGTGEVGSGRATVRTVAKDELRDLRASGFSLNAAFVGREWLAALSGALTLITNLATVSRGERRGWNAMFYPEGTHGIDDDFLVPALRSSSSQRTLVAEPDAEAFSCEESLEKLDLDGATGTLAWIRRFENSVNQRGEPLTQVLARGSTPWYSMPRDVTADFVTSMNPGERLFFSRFRTPAFVDQRLIRVSCNEGVDVELLHALLNTSPSMFCLEATGFGRGLGALDLTPTNLRLSLRVLDPTLLDKHERSAILKAFEPVLARDVLGVWGEFRDRDRLEFEKVVGEVYGLGDGLEAARSALLDLMAIRFAAVNRNR